jgi:hypothetical protein
MEEICSRFTWSFLENKLRDTIQSELEGRTDDALLTRQECISFLRCSSTSLYYHMKNGGLNYYRLGKTLLFKKSDLIDYITVNNRKDG